MSFMFSLSRSPISHHTKMNIAPPAASEIPLQMSNAVGDSETPTTTPPNAAVPPARHVMRKRNTPAAPPSGPGDRRFFVMEEWSNPITIPPKTDVAAHETAPRTPKPRWTPKLFSPSISLWSFEHLMIWELEFLRKFFTLTTKRSYLVCFETENTIQKPFSFPLCETKSSDQVNVHENTAFDPTLQSDPSKTGAPSPSQLCATKWPFWANPQGSLWNCESLQYTLRGKTHLMFRLGPSAILQQRSEKQTRNTTKN